MSKLITIIPPSDKIDRKELEKKIQTKIYDTDLEYQLLTNEQIIQFAELYRFSSTRIDLKQFKEMLRNREV